MRFWLNLRMAFQSLLQHPGRTVLTLLGIVIGIVALVVMMALVEALQTTMRDATEPLGVGVFQVQKEPRFMRNSKNNEAARRKSFTLADVRFLQQRLTKVRAVAGEMWAWGVKASTSERSTQPLVELAGGMPPFLDANGLSLASGRFITEHDIEYERPVAVIGTDIMDALFPGGPTEALGSTMRAKGQTFQVIGVLSKQPTFFGAGWRNAVIIIPVTTFHRMFGFRSLHVTFCAKDPTKLGEAEEEATIALRWLRRVELGQPDDFEMFNNDSVNNQLDTMTLVIASASGGICFLALLVGGIGVMNIMLVSVTERTREIGVRKALGARPRTILGQFITEAISLAMLGGGIGVAVAYGLVIPAVIQPWSVGVAILSSSFIGLVAGIYPAARAARLNPIEALRYE